MKALSICCILLISLVVAEQVQGDGQYVKLCGREFIRAVIYTCGGSRWRRSLPESPQNLAEQENFFTLHSIEKEEASSTPEAQKMPLKVGYDDLHQTGTLEQLWASQKRSAQEKRDLDELLTTACCKNGCKKKDLNFLC
ncbi:insulin-like peptide INSL5 [Gastrophryne carolinensis]